MAPIPAQSVSALLSNEPAVFSEAVDVLLRVSRNIIKDPANPKFRSISLGSAVVLNKLLPASGALECLFEMGFQEGSDCLELPPSSPIENVRRMHDELLRKKEESAKPQVHKMNESPAAIATTPSAPKPGPSKEPVRPVKRTVPTSKVQHLRSTTRNPFLHKVLQYCDRVLQYEEHALQLKALKCIPLQDLKTRVETSIRNMQQAYKKKESETEPDNYQEVMLFSLITWFKEDFFSWVNSPPCPSCNEETTTAKETRASTSHNVDRIEVFECPKCQQEVLFPRYNDAGQLLVTRRGRCGEWANCFTLLCRAMGWDARLVTDETDHAWTEVYLILSEKWVHCDPCEGVIGAPLLYEAGWNKKLTYIMAFSCEEMQDVTWRYSSQHKAILKRRKLCEEEELVQLIGQVRDSYAQAMSPARRRFVTLRSLREVVEMLAERQPTPSDLHGRLSGALAWRTARGEAGDGSAHVWVIKKADLENVKWTLGYSASKDQYFKNGALASAGWATGVLECSNVQRKVEKDWKMAYLARTEGCESGEVVWAFKIDDGIHLEKVELKFATTLYKNGTVNVTLCSGDVCMRVNKEELWSTSELSGCTSLSLRAVLTGGEGDVAWQHAQLFRQGLADEAIPLQIILHLSPAGNAV